MYTSYFYVMVETSHPADRLALFAEQVHRAAFQHGTIGLINAPCIHKSTTNLNLRLVGVTLLIENRRDPQTPAVAGILYDGLSVVYARGRRKSKAIIAI